MSNNKYTDTLMPKMLRIGDDRLLIPKQNMATTSLNPQRAIQKGGQK